MAERLIRAQPELRQTPAEDRAFLLAILEQSRLTFELLRRLVDLLMPKEGGREGPTLEELLSRLIAQQHDLLVKAEEIQAAVLAVGTDLPQAVAEAIEDRTTPARSSARA